MCGLIKINGGTDAKLGGNGRKAIDRSKDLNVCTKQHVDNGLSFSR